MAVECEFFSLGMTTDSYTNITLSDRGRMAMEALYAEAYNATIDVSSRPRSGYSMEWIAKGDYSVANLIFANSEMYFHGLALSLLKGPVLTLNGTNIQTAEKAETYLKSNSIKVEPGTSFILGPGTAKMQFDSYELGSGFPFDIDPGQPQRKIYPEGMFNIRSGPGGTLNEGSLVIRIDSAFTASKLIADKLVAVDGIPQGPNGRVTWDFTDGYVTIKQR